MSNIEFIKISQDKFIKQLAHIITDNDIINNRFIVLVTDTHLMEYDKSLWTSVLWFPHATLDDKNYHSYPVLLISDKQLISNIDQINAYQANYLILTNSADIADSDYAKFSDIKIIFQDIDHYIKSNRNRFVKLKNLNHNICYTNNITNHIK